MNGLFLVVCGIILTGMLAGLAKGAVKIAVSLVATVLTVAIVFFATPYVSKAIVKMTPVDEFIEEQCLKTMTKALTGEAPEKAGLTEEQVRAALAGAGVSEAKLEEAGITVEDIVEGRISGKDLAKHGISSGILNGHSVEEVKQSIMDAEIPRQLQIAAIEAADMPEVFKERLLSNNNSEVYRKLGVTSFAGYISKYMSKLIIDICAFLGTFILATIVIRAVVFALDIVSELPGLGILNHLAGIPVGGAIALIVVGFLFVGITMLYTTSIGRTLMQMIDQNKYLSYLYSHNYVMEIITRFR